MTGLGAGLHLLSLFHRMGRAEEMRRGFIGFPFPRSSQREDGELDAVLGLVLSGWSIAASSIASSTAFTGPAAATIATVTVGVG